MQFSDLAIGDFFTTDLYSDVPSETGERQVWMKSAIGCAKPVGTYFANVNKPKRHPAWTGRMFLQATAVTVVANPEKS